MDCLLVFNLSRYLISSFIIIYNFFFHSCSLFFLFAFLSPLLFCFPSSSFFPPSSLFFQIWLQERLQLLQPLTIPPSTYLLRNFRDHRLHQNDVSFEVYMEFMGHIKETDIQWVMSGGISQAWFTVATRTTMCL